MEETWNIGQEVFDESGDHGKLLAFDEAGFAWVHWHNGARTTRTLKELFSVDPRERQMIMVDADKLEHLLNCMAQLDFTPMNGRPADRAIIRDAYADAREMLHSATTTACPPPCTSPASQAPAFKVGDKVRDSSNVDMTVTEIIGGIVFVEWVAKKRAKFNPEQLRHA